MRTERELHSDVRTPPSRAPPHEKARRMLRRFKVSSRTGGNERSVTSASGRVMCARRAAPQPVQPTQGYSIVNISKVGTADVTAARLDGNTGCHPIVLGRKKMEKGKEGACPY